MNGTLSLIIYLLDIKDYTPLLLIWLIDLYILRKTNEEDPKGIAIIDEIDLHLHPSLEQEVLARLKKHFQVFNLLYLHILNGTLNLKVKDTGNMIYRMQADEDTPNALPNYMAWIYSAAVYDFMGTPYADNEVKRRNRSHL